MPAEVVAAEKVLQSNPSYYTENMFQPTMYLSVFYFDK